MTLTRALLSLFEGMCVYGVVNLSQSNWTISAYVLAVFLVMFAWTEGMSGWGSTLHDS